MGDRPIDVDGAGAHQSRVIDSRRDDVRRRQRMRRSIGRVGTEGYTGEIPFPPAQTNLVHANVVGTDEEIESFRQRHMLPDRDPGPAGRKIPDLTVEHDFRANYDLCLLDDTQSPRMTKFNSARAWRAWTWGLHHDNRRNG